MRNCDVGLTAVVAMLAFGTPAFAKTMTVSGKLVDEGCGLKDAAAKASMKSDCETECAKRGEPVALVTTDGKVYRVGGALAANHNANLIAHMGRTVQITGDVTEASGRSVIVANAVKPVK